MAKNTIKRHKTRTKTPNLEAKQDTAFRKTTNIPNFVNKDFLKERDYWYKILKNEGFVDEEAITPGYYTPDPPLKISSWTIAEKLKIAKQNGTIEYFQVAQETLPAILQDLDKIQADIWQLHADGYTISETIKNRKKRRKTPKSTDQVKRILVKVRKKMVKYLEEQLKIQEKT